MYDVINRSWLSNDLGVRPLNHQIIISLQVFWLSCVDSINDTIIIRAQNRVL